MLVKTEAFVLRNRKMNESDSLLHLFSRKLGRISAVAKGARRSRSRFLAGVQPFVYSDFVLYSGRNLYTVNHVEPLRTFYSLREDYGKLSVASYMMELAEAEINEGQKNHRLFQLLGKGLTLTSCLENTPHALVRSFELQFVQLAGYEPQLNHCLECSLWEDHGTHWFSVRMGGVLCDKCRHMDPAAFPLTLTCLRLMHTLLNRKIEETSCLRLRSDLNNELSSLMEKYLLFQLDRHTFRTRRFLENTMDHSHRVKAFSSQELIKPLTGDMESDTFKKNEKQQCSHEQKE